MSFCLSQTSSCFFFFVSGWNRAIFWPSVLHDPLYKTLFFDFWFRPPNAKNLLPQIFGQKIQIVSFLFLDGIDLFLAVSSPWPPTKRCSSIFDLGSLTPKIYKKIAFNSACMADRPDIFAPTRGFSGMADSMEPYKMLRGPTIVAMATTFGLGAEI